LSYAGPLDAGRSSRVEPSRTTVIAVTRVAHRRHCARRPSAPRE